MMRIAIITQGLSPIVRPLKSSGHDVIAIAESARPDSGKITHRHLRRWISASLTFFFPNRMNLEQYAKKEKIPYFWISNDSIQYFGNWLQTHAPDLVVVYSMSSLLPSKIFRIPVLGTINLHPSYLPYYRGPNPEFWQYRDFCKYGAATVHYIDEGEDTGDIIYQGKVPITPGTRSPQWNKIVIGQLGVNLLLQAVDGIVAGNSPRIHQPLLSPTARARRIKSSEHPAIIEWENWQVERVWHVLRGTESWLKCIDQPSGPMEGQLWTVGDYVIEEPRGRPGAVMRDQRGYYVACRDGSIRLSVDFSVKRFVRALLRARR